MNETTLYLQEPYDSELVSHNETTSRDTGRPSAFSGTKVCSDCTAVEDAVLQHSQLHCTVAQLTTFVRMTFNKSVHFYN